MITMGGSILERMVITHKSTRGWRMRGTGGIAGAQAAENIIDTDGIIPVMDGKKKVRETT